ncbi:hypothetical protein B0H13DRAFT_1897856 [Mycena leptocephala]|nr:hypothetical protein B0H13DRAFT_1897856 [Mycena leptocephala]
MFDLRKSEDEADDEDRDLEPVHKQRVILPLRLPFAHSVNVTAMANGSGIKQVQKDIRDTIAELDPSTHPQVQQRWFLYNPKTCSRCKQQNTFSPMSSPTKQSTSGKRMNPKPDAAAENDIDIDSDSSIEILPSLPRNKRKRASPEVTEDDEDDSVDMKFEASPATNIGIGAVQVQIHHQLPQILATGCHTSTANFSIASMKWKFDRPGNAAKKPFANETVFDVMITSLKDRKKDYVCSVFMLPPTEVKKELMGQG